jgi:hypothetical protein
MSQKITLPRSGDAPLTFLGELLAESDGSGQCGRTNNRWYELEIYRVAGERCGAGDYVVSIGYRTRWQGELDHFQAESCDSPAEVRAALREYDLVAHVGGYPPGEQYADRQARLLADLRTRYAAQVSAILGDAGDEFAEDVSAAVHGPDVAARRRDFCRRLELESLRLSRAEACAACDAGNGTILDESSWQHFWCEVADADRLNGLGKKWQIDGQALAIKIHDASPGAKLALAEAVEQFWRSHAGTPIDEGLRAVGLLPDAKAAERATTEPRP